jgi:hypothetical protein
LKVSDTDNSLTHKKWFLQTYIYGQLSKPSRKPFIFVCLPTKKQMQFIEVLGEVPDWNSLEPVLIENLEFLHDEGLTSFHC